MTKKEVMNKQIDSIMDWFDFEKVHKVMTSLDWKWGDSVPEAGELRSEARRLLRDLVDRGWGYAATGGFHAKRYQGEDDGGPWVKLELLFTVDDWSEDGEYYDE